MGENIITNIMKVSVTGTSLKKVRKKFRNRRARKTTVSKLKKAMIVSSGHRGINFLNDYDEANEEERRWLSLANDRPNRLMKNPAPRKSKYYINTLQFPTSQQLWLYSPIDDSVERKQIASFIFGF